MLRWMASAVFGVVGSLLTFALLTYACPKPVRADTTLSVSLSSLNLSRATQGWGKPGVDRSVEGHPLTLHGRTFPHGFGTHSPGALAIRLDGGAARFTATVGVDDEVRASGKGSAEFEVLGDDDRILWRSGICRPGDVPQQVSVGLRGVRQVILEPDAFAADGRGGPADIRPVDDRAAHQSGSIGRHAGRRYHLHP